MTVDDEGITVMGKIHFAEGHSESIPPGVPICSTWHEEERKVKESNANVNK